jgi:hypothetical protein
LISNKVIHLSNSSYWKTQSAEAPFLGGMGQMSKDSIVPKQNFPSSKEIFVHRDLPTFGVHFS